MVSALQFWRKTAGGLTPNNELTRLWRELTGLHNSMFDLEGKIKDACQNDKEVADKIAGVYSAIESLQDAIKKHEQKKGKANE